MALLEQLDRFGTLHGRQLRRLALPIVVVATLCSMAGEGFGIRATGTIALALVAVWAIALYIVSEQKYEKLTSTTVREAFEINVLQLHQHVCTTASYWEYLRYVLAEVAKAGLVSHTAGVPQDMGSLGKSLVNVETMVREWLDQLVPANSRYVVYYMVEETLEASSVVHNGWRGRPPDFRSDSRRLEIFLAKARLGEWIVVPDVTRPALNDRNHVDLAFDCVAFKSFALVPLRIEEPLGGTDADVLPIGCLVIEGKAAGSLTEHFCRTAIQVTADLLALAFRGATISRSRRSHADA